jgi:hypothetical protein
MESEVAAEGAVRAAAVLGVRPPRGEVEDGFARATTVNAATGRAEPRAERGAARAMVPRPVLRAALAAVERECERSEWAERELTQLEGRVAYSLALLEREERAGRAVVGERRAMLLSLADYLDRARPPAMAARLRGLDKQRLVVEQLSREASAIARARRLGWARRIATVAFVVAAAIALTC